MMPNRAAGPYAFTFWVLIAVQHPHPASPLVRRVRANLALLWCVAIIVNIGMWLERYVIVVTSLHRDFMPSRVGHVCGGRNGITPRSGARSDCLRRCCFCFMRLLPAISISEMRELVAEREERRL